jgi:hypothetical protein
VSTSAVPPVADKDVRNFLRDYHDLLPGDPQRAYALTGPSLQASVSYADYAAFWSQFDQVKLNDVRVAPDSLTATGTLEYDYANGGRQREEHRFTLVAAADGTLRMDRDDVVQVIESR